MRLKNLIKTISIIFIFLTMLLACQSKYNNKYTNPPSGFVFVRFDDYPKIKGVKYKRIKSLYVCDHEVTQAEYEKYCTYAGPVPNETYGKGENYPVYYVNFFDALVYCNKRSIAEGLTPYYKINNSTNPDDWGDIPDSESHVNYETWYFFSDVDQSNGYHLPIDNEWQYLARGSARDTTKQNEYAYKYAGSDIIDLVAWYRNNSNNKCHEVKGKKPNELGIYDMSGNVSELTFCPGPTRGDSYFPAKGGNLASPAKGCELDSEYHDRWGVGCVRHNHIGFRVIRTVEYEEYEYSLFRRFISLLCEYIDEVFIDYTRVSALITAGTDLNSVLV